MSSMWLACLALSISIGAGALPAPAVQSPVDIAQSQITVLKITAGASGGLVNDIYTVTEERTVFSRVADREVVVLFQWEGRPGAHKLLAQWRSPTGSLTSSSAFDYIAKDRRFGAYWRMPLSPSLPVGTWSIEATVDNQPGGRLTFEIRDEDVSAPIVRRPLTPAELYDRLNRVFVVIERSTEAGRKLNAAGGFMTGSGRIYTSLAAVDGADRLLAVSADGSRRELTSLSSWHRRQDWAIVDAGGPQEPSLPTAAADSAKVGDRLFSIEGGVGGRALMEGSITGQGDAPGGGRRFLATFTNGFGTPGAPVINEFGELVGLVGGTNVPGATQLSDVLRFRSQMKGTPIIPLSQIRFRADAAAESVAALQQRGELVASVTGEEHVVSGGFAKQIVKGRTVAPADQRDEFTTQDKMFLTWISWNPQQRIRGQGTLRMFDVDNRVILESKPARVNLPKGELTLSTWQIGVPNVPGYYRVDAMIDGKAMWRGFVRISQ